MSLVAHILILALVVITVPAGVEAPMIILLPDDPEEIELPGSAGPTLPAGSPTGTVGASEARGEPDASPAARAIVETGTLTIPVSPSTAGGTARNVPQMSSSPVSSNVRAGATFR